MYTSTIKPNVLFTAAHIAGQVAADALTPRPMIVEDKANGKEYHIPDGVCGFAWVKIRPAKGKFVSWLKSAGIGSTDTYAGGYQIWISDYGQSMDKKYAYADAFAEYLRNNGIKALADSRMD